MESCGQLWRRPRACAEGSGGHAMPPFAGGARARQRAQDGLGHRGAIRASSRPCRACTPRCMCQRQRWGTRRERPARLTGWEAEAVGVLQPLKEPLLAGPNWRHESPGGTHRGPCCSWAGHPEPPLPSLSGHFTYSGFGASQVQGWCVFCRRGDALGPPAPFPSRRAPPCSPLGALGFGARHS